MGLVEIVRRALLVVDLVVKHQQQLVSPCVVHLRDVWILQQSFLQDLAEDRLLEELVVLSLKDLELAKSVLWLLLLVDSIRLDELLEGFQLHGSFSIFDWQRTEGIELRVLKLSQPL